MVQWYGLLLGSAAFSFGEGRSVRPGDVHEACLILTTTNKGICSREVR